MPHSETRDRERLIVANTPTLADVLDIIDSREGGQTTIEDSLEAIADDRARR